MRKELSTVKDVDENRVSPLVIKLGTALLTGHNSSSSAERDFSLNGKHWLTYNLIVLIPFYIQNAFTADLKDVEIQKMDMKKEIQKWKKKIELMKSKKKEAAKPRKEKETDPAAAKKMKKAEKAEKVAVKRRKLSFVIEVFAKICLLRNLVQ